MDRLEEIELEITQLSRQDYVRFARWFREHDQALWDVQMDADSASGRLDFLFDEGTAETRQGLVRDWPTRQ